MAIIYIVSFKYIWLKRNTFSQRHNKEHFGKASEHSSRKTLEITIVQLSKWQCKNRPGVILCFDVLNKISVALDRQVTTISINLWHNETVAVPSQGSIKTWSSYKPRIVNDINDSYAVITHYVENMPLTSEENLQRINKQFNSNKMVNNITASIQLFKIYTIFIFYDIIVKKRAYLIHVMQ